MAKRKYEIKYQMLGKDGKVSVGTATHNDIVEAESETNAIAEIKKKKAGYGEIHVVAVKLK